MNDPEIRLDTPENSERIEWIAGEIRLPILTSETENRISAQISVLPAGSANRPHIHSLEDELFYVISGHVIIRCGHLDIELGCGDAVLAPRGLPHTLSNPGPDEAEVLVALTPGNIEAAFRRASGKKSEELESVFSDYGVIMLPGAFDPDFRHPDVPEPGNLVLARSGSGEGLFLAGDLYTIMVDSLQSNQLLNVVHFEVPPGGGPLPHIHEKDDEFFLILEGEVELWSEKGTTLAKAGDMAILPAKIPHGFKNKTDRTARMLALTAPGGFDHFLRDAGSPAVEGQQPPAMDEAEIKKIIEASRRHHLVLLPPEHD